MGKLIDGEWVRGSIINSNEKGTFKRKPRTFRGTIGKGDANVLPESGRYHLYVGYACPWAHRTLIYRELKGLKEHIDISVVHPDMLDMGWRFSDDFEGATGDSLFNYQYLHQVYQQAQKDISTSATVPILWDKKTKKIVNNESSEIIRIFNEGFNTLTGNTLDFYPEALRAQIDHWNDKIYLNINNGVYRSGFATSQQAYEDANTGLFNTLDEIERHLENSPFLVGDTMTEANWRLIPTLLRFDIVYFVHFKTNLRRIKDYKNLSEYTRRFYAMDAVKNTTNFAHIKRHYYYSHESINPHRIIPVGPADVF